MKSLPHRKSNVVAPPASRFMRLALRSARHGMRAGAGGPFGACLVHRGRALAVSHNRVLETCDPTCHAEVNVIRAASKKLGTPFLQDTALYSTTEPCPMCFAAIHWARIPLVVCGTTIADVARRGFNELSVSNQRLKQIGRSPVKLVKGFLLRECRKLLAEWDRLPNKRIY